MRGRSTAEDSWPEFLTLWRALRQESARPGSVILVEGERDRFALRRLGIEGEIGLLHNGRALATIAHEFASRRTHVIVLTDWDLKGGRLARRMKEFLEADAGSLNLEFRRRLARVLRGEVVHVEGLHRWARRVADRAGSSLEECLEET